jgi:hypothetical protein
MSRWFIFLICLVAGLALLLGGLLLPAHLRAVDAVVLHKAGRGTPSLIDGGQALVQSKQLGAAQLFATAAQRAWIPNAHQLEKAVAELARREPALKILGGAEPGRLGALLLPDAGDPKARAADPVTSPIPFTEFIIRSDRRTRALELLQTSANPLAQSLLLLRSLTNTVIFPASHSASGQALDAAIAICGLLSEAGHLSPELNNAVLVLAAEVNRTWNPAPLEQVLMDVMSLGQRFNWGQLATFVRQINDVESLRVLAYQVRRDEALPVVYAAVCLSGNAAGVAAYLTNFSETGLNDLRYALRFGAGGVNELVQRNQQLCNAAFCERVAAFTAPGKSLAFALDHSPKTPRLALLQKWSLYLLGGFFVAAAFHFARRVTTLERPLEVRGFHLARETLFALGFLVVVLLLSEPFLAQGSQKELSPFRLRLPTVGNVAPAGSPGALPKIMNQLSLLTMLLFFVLQALLYVASLVKLAEIRRQQVPSRMKLKLLENEDHLFDAGLYLGFFGTIVSLILVSLGVFKQPSLMAAYSSTSFGILFVVTFKILHLRRARRQLLLKTESESSNRVAEPALAAPL